jgi:hypothetical protein
MKKLRAIAVGLAALMLLTTGCDEGQEAAEMLPQMSDAQAKDIVEAYAEEALHLSGVSGFSQSSLTPGPCEGRRGEVSDGIYTIQGAYQLIVPGPEQQRVIDRVRDGWRALGYAITSERTFDPDRGGQVFARNPADGAEFVISTGEVPALSLAIYAGCFRRTTSEVQST